MPTISPTCIRLNQWRKQGYLDQKFKDFYEVTKNAIGLHSTDYWTPYLSVWSRIGDYDAKSVFEALNTGKRIVRSRAFRNTQHVVLIEDFVLITRALGPQLERSMIPAPPIKKLEEPEREKLLNELLSAFEEGPMTMQGLKQALPHVGEMMRWLLLILMGRGQVIRTSATHARSTIQMYDLTARWLPRFSLTDISEEDARAEILFKYIVSFGPVTLEDISWWLPCKKTEAKSHIESLDEKL
ncbi:MAG: DNA glycosylase AlkZ-like family protein, partial [Candidatus Thorarchaeota archaeon]